MTYISKHAWSSPVVKMSRGRSGQDGLSSATKLAHGIGSFCKRMTAAEIRPSHQKKNTAPPGPIPQMRAGCEFDYASAQVGLKVAHRTLACGFICADASYREDTHLGGVVLHPLLHCLRNLRKQSCN
jgi:hypothetical protein